MSAAGAPPVRILFVCLGNICRSPTAEGVTRELAAAEAPELVLELDSAGTADYHVGAPPDSRSCAHAARRGYRIDHLRARQVTREDFRRFDLLLAMDHDNLRDLTRLAPSEGRARIALPSSGPKAMAVTSNLARSRRSNNSAISCAVGCWWKSADR